MLPKQLLIFVTIYVAMIISTLIILRDYRYSHLISTYNFNLHDRAGTFASVPICIIYGNLEC